jgi:hypothetical protein
MVAGAPIRSVTRGAIRLTGNTALIIGTKARPVANADRPLTCCRRASVTDWSTDGILAEALRIDHLNSGNQRGTNASVSPECFGMYRSMHLRNYAAS